MVGRATFAACSWMLDNLDNVERFYLESNLATDKKHSQINIMRTRGKRVIAEAVVSRDVLVQHMRVEPESLQYHSQISNVGSFPLRRQQQRRPLAQRHHRDVHRDRPGRRQCRRVVLGDPLHRASARRRPLYVA